METMADARSSTGGWDGEPGNGEQPAGPRHLKPAAWSDAELITHLRAREERAVAEFYERLMPPMLQVARRLRVQVALRREVVADVLRAVCTTLVRPERAVPTSLPAYVARALRRHVQLLDRLGRGAPEPLEEAWHIAAAPATMPWDAPATDADGVDGDTTAHVLGRLAVAVAAALTAEERQLLAWLAEHVPQREIARWRGVPYGAMRGRILRLREKARKLAWRWVASRPPDERARLTRRLELAARPPRPRVRLDATSPSTGSRTRSSTAGADRQSATSAGAPDDATP